MEVYLTREIQNEVDNAYVDEVVNNIKSVPENEELVMPTTCIGGDTFQGDRLNRIIMEHPNITRQEVVGVAASMAASLFPAFDSVEFDPDAEIMLHKARITDDEGFVLEKYTPEQAERIEVFNQKIYNRFVKMVRKNLQDEAKIKTSIEFLHNVFLSDNQDNHWLTAKEAEGYGFGKVVAVERKDGKPYRLAASMDIKQIKEKFNTKNMGLFNKDKKVMRVHALLDGRQVAVTSTKEEIQVGDILTPIGSTDSLKGKIKLSNNMVAEVDEEEKVVNIEEMPEEEKSDLEQRIQDLEEMVKAFIASQQSAEPEDKVKAMEEKEEELENKIEAVNALAKSTLEAASLIKTTAKLDKPENKDRKETISLSAKEEHLRGLNSALNQKIEK